MPSANWQQHVVTLCHCGGNLKCKLKMVLAKTFVKHLRHVVVENQAWSMPLCFNPRPL